MKTIAFPLLVASGLLLLAGLLLAAILAKDPLEQQYLETVEKLCEQKDGFYSEAEVLAAFPELRLAKEKLERCQSLKSQLCRLTQGPAGGPGEQPGHCRKAYLQIRQEISRLLESFAAKHFLYEVKNDESYVAYN